MFCLMIFPDSHPRFIHYTGGGLQALAILGTPMDTIYFTHDDADFVLHYRDTNRDDHVYNELATLIAYHVGYFDEGGQQVIRGSAIIALGNPNDPDNDLPIQHGSDEVDALRQFMYEVGNSYEELYWLGTIPDWSRS